MTKRFTNKLNVHVLLVEKHAEFLVKRFAGFHFRAQRIIAEKAIFGEAVDWKDDKQVRNLYLKMKLIQEELVCVESFLKENWPGLTELYEFIKGIDIKELDAGA
jgi:hypothetical protein